MKPWHCLIADPNSGEDLLLTPRIEKLQIPQKSLPTAQWALFPFFPARAACLVQHRRGQSSRNMDIYSFIGHPLAQLFMLMGQLEDSVFVGVPVCSGERCQRVKLTLEIK